MAGLDTSNVRPQSRRSAQREGGRGSPFFPSNSTTSECSISVIASSGCAGLQMVGRHSVRPSHSVRSIHRRYALSLAIASSRSISCTSSDRRSADAALRLHDGADTKAVTGCRVRDRMEVNGQGSQGRSPSNKTSRSWSRFHRSNSLPRCCRSSGRDRRQPAGAEASGSRHSG
jgi:hypothetical protein